jgi:cobalt/nickel transport system permease protein
MSPVALSDHIPDLDLITTYAEHQTSWFSGISPWTKFFFLIILVILITVSRSLLLVAILYGVVLAVYWHCNLPVRKLIAWYCLPVLFVISLVAILAWNEPGNAVISLDLGIVHPVLTDGGIILVVTLLMKALVTFTYSILLLMTTRYFYLSGMISRIFPSPLDQVFLMTYRFMFLTRALLDSLLKAVYSRGGGLMRSFRAQGALFAEVAGLTFIRSFEQAERVNRAMISRGYCPGSYGSRTAIPLPTVQESVLLGLAACLLLLTGLDPSFGGWQV